MRFLSTILRWVALCGFGAGLAGCRFEQIEFDPAADHSSARRTPIVSLTNSVIANR